MNRTGTIYGINGPVIYLKGNTGFKMSEMVYVGEEKLVGEVISLDKDLTTIQVYEETSGLRPGEKVEASGSAVSVTLAPVLSARWSVLRIREALSLQKVSAWIPWIGRRNGRPTLL